MPKDEWGVKRVCPHCAVRFYDLMRDPMTCPSCGEEFTVENLTAPKGKSAAPSKAATSKTAAAPTSDDDDDVVLDDDTSDDLEDELLEEDDDDDDVSLDDIADVADDKEE
ncbi:TIGR02300 family protein [Halovulum sp. GXIMD14793]